MVRKPDEALLRTSGLENSGSYCSGGVERVWIVGFRKERKKSSRPVCAQQSIHGPFWQSQVFVLGTKNVKGMIQLVIPVWWYQ